MQSLGLSRSVLKTFLLSKKKRRKSSSSIINCQDLSPQSVGATKVHMAFRTVISCHVGLEGGSVGRLVGTTAIEHLSSPSIALERMELQLSGRFET